MWCKRLAQSLCQEGIDRAKCPRRLTRRKTFSAQERSMGIGQDEADDILTCKPEIGKCPECVFNRFQMFSGILRS